MIGIYGGTFDPVHFGHLRPALEVQQALGLNEVRFIPTGQPPHRDMPHATAAQRLAMLRAAIDDQSGFVVDEREVQRAGLSRGKKPAPAPVQPKRDGKLEQTRAAGCAAFA